MKALDYRFLHSPAYGRSTDLRLWSAATELGTANCLYICTIEMIWALNKPLPFWQPGMWKPLKGMCSSYGYILTTIRWNTSSTKGMTNRTKTISNKYKKTGRKFGLLLDN